MVLSTPGHPSRPAFPVLVDAAWLAAAMSPGGTAVTPAVPPGTRVVLCDVRWYLDGRDGRVAFREAHAAGAVFVDLDAVCSAHGRPATDGRHPLPTVAAFAASVGALGIGDGDIVVAYDDSGGGTAGRFVWMLRALGAPAALLDGGLAAWTATHPDRIGSGEVAAVTPATFTARTVAWSADHVADWGDAERAGHVGDSPAGGSSPAGAPLLLDARAPDRYRGDSEPVDPRAGHIPGAVNLPWASLVDPVTRRFLPVDELRRRLAAAGVAGDREVVVSCGSGVSACALYVALEQVGHHHTRLFVPSWSGWSSDPGRVAATGDAP